MLGVAFGLPRSGTTKLHRVLAEEESQTLARLLKAGWAMVTDRHELEEFGRESLELLSSHMDRYLRQHYRFHSMARQEPIPKIC